MSAPERPPEPSTFERAAAAGRSNALMAPLLALTGMAATIMVARSLTAAEFAFFATVTALRSVMGYLGDLGTGAAAGRMFAQMQVRGAGQQARRLFTRLLVLRLPLLAVVATVLLVFGEAVASALSLTPEERSLLPVLAAISIVEMLGPLGAYALSGTFHHAHLNRVTLVAGVVQPVAIVAAGVLGAGLPGIVIGVLLGTLVRCTGYLLLGLRAIRSIERSGPPIAGLASTYMRVASASVLGKLAALLHQRQALTFVGLSAFGRVDVAAFALAYDFAQQALTAVATPILSLLTPSLSAVSEDPARSERAYRFLTRLLAVAVLPLGFMLAATAPTLMPSVFGAQFEHATLYASIFLPALALEIVLLGPPTALMLADDVFLATYRRVKYATIATAILYVPLITWSLPAAVLLMVSVRVLSAASLHVLIYRRTGVSAFGGWLWAVLITTAAAAASAGLLTWLLPVTLPSLAVSLAGASLAASLAARFSGLVQQADIELAQRAMPVIVRPLRLLQRASS